MLVWKCFGVLMRMENTVKWKWGNIPWLRLAKTFLISSDFKLAIEKSRLWVAIKVGHCQVDSHHSGWVLGSIFWHIWPRSYFFLAVLNKVDYVHKWTSHEWYIGLSMYCPVYVIGNRSYLVHFPLVMLIHTT